MKHEEQYISALHRKNMLYGTIIRSPIPKGYIANIDVPRDHQEEMVIISSKDIPGSNAVKIMQDTMPLLANEEISFIGQPILAVFAPSYEEAKLFGASIKLEFESKPSQPTDHSKESPTEEKSALSKEPTFLERILKEGDIDTVLQESHSVVEHTFQYEGGRTQFSAPTGALAEPEEDRIIIYAATQWPFHVRNTAASVCGIQKRKLLVRQTAYRPTYGEKLIYPSLYGSLAALCAVKSGKPARLISQFPLFHPSVTVTRKTGIDEEGTPLGEDIEIIADVGAYPVFVDELITHLSSGVTGYVPLKASRITARAVRSNTPPKYYFNGFGYDVGLMTSESQATFLVENLQVNPAQWRLNNFVKKQLPLMNGSKIKPPDIKKLIDTVTARSDFHRKFAVNRINKQQRRKRSISPGYLRGIGISSGFAPNGFSSSFPGETHFSVSVRLDENDKVTINTSMNISGAVSTWIETVHQILGIPKKSIFIAQGDTNTLPDSGPHILSRDIAILTPLVQRCCESIRNQRFKAPLPLEAKRGYRPKGSPKGSRSAKSRKEETPISQNTVSAEDEKREESEGAVGSSAIDQSKNQAIDQSKNQVNQQANEAPNPQSPKEPEENSKENSRKRKIAPPFAHMCWGAMTVELEVDSVTFLPEFRGIFCSLDCGKVFNKKALISGLKSKLLNCITDSVGGRITSEFLPPIDIELIEHDDGQPLSGSQTITGLFKAAFLSAFSQALDKEVTSLPVSPQKILAYLEEK